MTLLPLPSPLSLFAPFLQLFDLHGLYQDVYTNAGVFGFTNLTWSCLQGDPLTAITEQPDTVIGFMCTNPRDHMFWDSSHPTTWMHSIIADSLYPVLRMAGRALD
jgi:phospholipase/lecithinase/hemolysin